jgi:hypothetical protein
LINYCHISEAGVFLNGEQLNRIDAVDVSDDWKKQVYKQLKMDYPKFYKMDDLSKMTLLSIELLKQKVAFDKFEDDAVSILFANSKSSAYTDSQFIKSYAETSPSPSLFVYTLPNITTGELAIYMKWYGESKFFIQNEFTAFPINDLLRIEQRKGAKACLIGWVEKTEEKETCSLFFIEDIKTTNEQEIFKLYNQTQR